MTGIRKTAVLVLVSRLLVFLPCRNVGTETIHFHSDRLLETDHCARDIRTVSADKLSHCVIFFFFFFFQLLNLLPQSNAEACIFLVTPELLNNRSFFLCGILCLLVSL